MNEDIKTNKTITPTIIKEDFVFSKYHGEIIPDVIQCLRDYLYEHRHMDLKIWTGCDSIKTMGGNAIYVIAVCVYRQGKGAHIIHTKLKQPISSIYDKLWKETELSIMFTKFLIEKQFLTIKTGDTHQTANAGGNIVPYMIDLDYNSKPDAVSSYLLSAGKGYCEQFQVMSREKPMAWAASYFADHIARGKNLNNGNAKNKPKYTSKKKFKKMKYKENTMTLVKGGKAV